MDEAPAAATHDAPAAAPTPAAPVDTETVLRSRKYLALLVLAAVIGVLVSLVSWAFLEAVSAIQQGVYVHLPSALGFAKPPVWWPLPWLTLAGVLTAIAIVRLPGHGGHVPADGLNPGAPRPIDLPGIVLAALATLGLGMVLGPEAPLIALGSGLGLLAVKLSRRDVPDRVGAVVAAAGAFAAISTIFGSPVIGAVILIEAAGLGGAALPLVLLPGLIAAGLGSLVFIGVGSVSGLSTAAYALTPISLPQFSVPSLADFGWTIALAAGAALFIFLIVGIAKASKRLVDRKPMVLIPLAGIVVAGLAIAYSRATSQPPDGVLFSGQDAFGSLFGTGTTIPLTTLGLLLLFKGIAWAISLGNFRGGPTFPALFLGAVAGMLAANLPGFSQTPAVAVLMGAMCVSVLRLPLASIVIALLLTYKGGPGSAPLIIVGVVVAYITTEKLRGRRATATSGAQAAGAAPLESGGAKDT
jgi:H+/Cl- antiporter ClcA